VPRAFSLRTEAASPTGKCKRFLVYVLVLFHFRTCFVPSRMSLCPFCAGNFSQCALSFSRSPGTNDSDPIKIEARNAAIRSSDVIIVLLTRDIAAQTDLKV
jgi:hypothetical protein